MLDAVDAGIDEIGEGLLAEHVCRHPCSRDMGGCDGCPHGLGGPHRGEVATLPVDPVGDDLYPAVALARLLGGGGGQFCRLDFDAQTAEVTLGPGEMTAGADESWQVLPSLDPPVIHRRAAVTQQQRPAVPVGDRLLFLLVAVGEPALPEPDADMAVRVDQPGYEPALGHRRSRRHAFVRHPPSHDKQIPRLSLGQDRPADVQRRRPPPGAPRLLWSRPPTRLFAAPPARDVAQHVRVIGGEPVDFLPGRARQQRDLDRCRATPPDPPDCTGALPSPQHLNHAVPVGRDTGQPLSPLPRGHRCGSGPGCRLLHPASAATSAV